MSQRGARWMDSSTPPPSSPACCIPSCVSVCTFMKNPKKDQGPYQKEVFKPTVIASSRVARRRSRASRHEAKILREVKQTGVYCHTKKKLDHLVRWSTLSTPCWRKQSSFFWTPNTAICIKNHTPSLDHNSCEYTDGIYIYVYIYIPVDVVVPYTVRRY